MPPEPRSALPWIAVLALVLALGFLGARGIWDPDEGRYTNVALNMLDSGDWLNPRRNHEVGHWTKPPLTYWAIASSIAVFGPHPWAARLPAALAYLLCVWLAWRSARRLAPGSEDAAALVYATTLFTVGASQLITTDYLLAACQSLAMWAFIEARFGSGLRARAWIALMWAGFALSFLTKGPPGLLPLPVILAFDFLMPDRHTRRLLQWSGLVLFGLLALPWYVAVIHGNPGLFRYFVHDEVVNRVTTNEFGRHGQWYGWLQVYVPVLLLGTLPWTPTLLRWARALPAQARSWWRRPAQRATDAPWLLLALWVLLPLLVFCLARSRMPLYLLPLFTPLALVVALRWRQEGRSLPRWPWLLAWTALLMALKIATSYWPTHKNAADWAQAIDERAPFAVEEVVFVEDMARYGLHLHLGTRTQIEKISYDDVVQARYNPEYDEPLVVELGERESGVVWVCKQADWPRVRARIAELGYVATPMGTPYQQRIIFRVAEAAP